MNRSYIVEYYSKVNCTIRISSSTNEDERMKIESRARIVREGSVT
ncbi:hypothetical protein HanRHA438_Chr06g0254681 [Helianthus annuus]|nr:hypothetical protein HanRHA438_Chr06g0254681 [Helianthus annuus]